MTGVKRPDIRMVNGITITLSATESTGFSPVGHLTNRIVDGLRKREAVIKIMEGNGDGEESEKCLGCCGDTAVDKRVCCDRAADRCGGLVSNTLRGYMNLRQGARINRACPVDLTCTSPVQVKKGTVL